VPFVPKTNGAEGGTCDVLGKGREHKQTERKGIKKPSGSVKKKKRKSIVWGVKETIRNKGRGGTCSRYFNWSKKEKGTAN